jgi:hypothetical protein
MNQSHAVRSRISRRQALGRLAALFAAGLWPGALVKAGGVAKTEKISFVVANDFHHGGPECDGWFAGLFRQMTAHPGVEFGLALGDFADRGAKESLVAIARAAKEARLELYPTPGNHDNDVALTTAWYEEIFPGRLNYSFTRSGWQFVAIDTTQGKDWRDTQVSAATLQWLDDKLGRLDPRMPTILLTHFPLVAAVPMCPRNAEAVLARFLKFNLRAVFSGHHHGQTEHRIGQATLVTNVCCSRIGANHDGDLRKGYWLCQAGTDQSLTRQFVAFAPPLHA